MSSEEESLWHKDAVIYQLHVRAFCDSNGDGIGDFAGLTSKLDYLKELGINTLWLLPFYPSPLRDGCVGGFGHHDSLPDQGEAPRTVGCAPGLSQAPQRGLRPPRHRDPLPPPDGLCRAGQGWQRPPFLLRSEESKPAPAIPSEGD